MTFEQFTNTVAMATTEGGGVPVRSFHQFWHGATGGAESPFPYQFRLATARWPDLLKIPTGLGKTAGVILAWMYKRLEGDPDTPRRLVYCLPMRTLVEQTAAQTRSWIEKIEQSGLDALRSLPRQVRVLMGGETDHDWIRAPELTAIVIGVQDILLSRALMRGYGVSRSRWPVDFALLHNDAMWVFDEVQLMAAGVPTSAQLEAFRRQVGTLRGCRSLWMSATLERDWLRTVDFRKDELVEQSLEAEDRENAVVLQRLAAPKALAKAATAISSTAVAEKGGNRYAESLAEEVLSRHRRGKTTLVIVNRVNRAQALYAALSGSKSPPLLLIHSRFRPAERRMRNEELTAAPDEHGRIVVATQAVEAGVDISSAVLFTELAPWAALVQRFGRLNRRGEESDAQGFWIDIATDAGDKEAAALSLPYGPLELASARERLQSLGDVSPSLLERFPHEPAPSWTVLRRKDLYQLFDTDPDLTGFDVDVSPYVRGADDTDLHIFWRELADGNKIPQGVEANRPHRDELCAVSIGEGKRWLINAKKRCAEKKERLPAFVWDWLERRWTRLDPERLWPGALVLVDAALGGYDQTRGFDASSRAAVAPVLNSQTILHLPDGFDEDADTRQSRAVLLPDHLRHVRDEAARLCSLLDVPAAEAQAVISSALWHDLGKTHDVFKARCDLEPDEPALAKSPNYSWARKVIRVSEDGKEHNRNRRYFRHELASALAWLRCGPQDEAQDCIAYLIAAHHGKVRLGLRALPDERGPDDAAARFARGVWDGDRLPAFFVDELSISDTVLELDVMEIGGGATGRSWATRTQALLDRYGPFRLAFLEALVRIADWRASETEQNGGLTDTGESDA